MAPKPKDESDSIGSCKGAKLSPEKHSAGHAIWEPVESLAQQFNGMRGRRYNMAGWEITGGQSTEAVRASDFFQFFPESQL